jgi:hypothetical protein
LVERVLPRRVEGDGDGAKTIREEDLQNHMDGDKEEPADSKGDSEQQSQIKKELARDNQLVRALDVLKSWEILSQMKYGYQ